MGRVREITTVVVAGIKEILNSGEDGETLNKEQEELLAQANKISKKRIDELSRNYSGELSSKREKESNDNIQIQRSAKEKYAVSKQEDKGQVNSEAEKTKSKKIVNEEIEK